MASFLAILAVSILILNRVAKIIWLGSVFLKLGSKDICSTIVINKTSIEAAICSPHISLSREFRGCLMSISASQLGIENSGTGSHKTVNILSESNIW